MTQNPQKFTAPINSSTQKPTSDTIYQTAVNAVCKVEKENVRQRTTFKLESNPNFSPNSKPADDDTRSRFSCFSARSQFLGQTSNSEAQKSRCDRGDGCFSARLPRTPALTTTARSLPKKPVLLSSLVEPVVVSDVLDQDLDAFFLSDPVWDDPADDDLLCEMCEDLENQIQSSDNTSAKQTPVVRQTSNRRAAPQPSNRTWGQQEPPASQSAASSPETSRSHAGCRLFPLTSLQAFGWTWWRIGSDALQDPATSAQRRAAGSSQLLAAPLRNANKEQFTFKKPNKPVSTATDEGEGADRAALKTHRATARAFRRTMCCGGRSLGTVLPASCFSSSVVGKCSAAEIELKKLRAMEKRRQRLKAAQNLGAPDVTSPSEYRFCKTLISWFFSVSFIFGITTFCQRKLLLLSVLRFTSDHFH